MGGAEMMARGHPTLGKKIRYYRKLLGFSLDDLSRATGFSQSLLSRWERGLADPDFESVLRLAPALGVNPDTLWNLNHPPSDPRSARPRRKALSARTKILQ